MKPVSPFEFNDYRDFLRARIANMPRRGHGQMTKIALFLRVHPTLITQVLAGRKNLTGEQTLLTAEFLGLNDAETDCILCLVDIERAGHHKLKARLRNRLAELKLSHDQAQARIPKHKVLGDAERAIFYSQWHYSAVRLLAGLGSFNSVEAIAEELNLPRRTTKEAIDFLLVHGLLRRSANRFELGLQRTYLPASSPLVSRHHTNWRLKAIENYDRLSDEEISFTAPISISRKDFAKVRKILLAAIQEISTLVAQSKEDSIGCLNVDLFFLGKK